MKMKQSELLKELPVTLTELKQWREENLEKGRDWWKEGVPIIWTEEAATRARCHFTGEQAEADPNEFSDVIRLNVVKLARNPHFVYADMNGKKVAVRCAKKRQNKLLRKPINVRIDRDGGNLTYTHEP